MTSYYSETLTPDPIANYRSTTFNSTIPELAGSEYHLSPKLLVRAKYQNALTTLGQQALAGKSIIDLFTHTLLLIINTIPVEIASIWQVMSDGISFQKIASTDDPILAKESAKKIINNTNQIIKNLWQKQKYVLFNYLHDHQSINEDWLPLIGPSSKSGMVMIIPSQDKPLGLLTVTTDKVYKFSNDDLDFLTAVTLMLATAVERKRSENLLEIQTKILEHIAGGNDLSKVFQNLCLLLEQQAPGAWCSILLLDKVNCCLKGGVAPSIPPEFSQAVNGLIIGENAGSCGTAAYRGEAVFVTDIATDPLWDNYRELALKYNVRACWSTPFFSQSGEVLGTFAISHQTPCQPYPYHLQMIKTATHLASIAVEGYRAAEKLRAQAHYDHLTGLPNRQLFLKELTQRIQHSKKCQLDPNLTECPYGFAVLFLDIDRFKLVNDSLGHNIGDQLLKAIAIRLQQCLSKKDLLARLGGDEFVILLDDVPNINLAEQLASKIKDNLIAPIPLQDHKVFTSVSIGITHSSYHYENAEDLLRDADTAMYHGKDKMMGNYQVFNPNMYHEALSRLQLEIDLRHAVEDLFKNQPSQFFLLYQPIVSLVTGEIAGFEALLRWQHPKHGLVSPVTFIPLAEETGLIIQLGKWVLYEASHQLIKWQKNWLVASNWMMSINVSGCQLLQPSFYQEIQKVLEITKIEPRCLKLEITESMFMETAGAVTNLLEHLQKLGIRLSLDDFGTGYSSLSYLHKFPINTLKVDRSFVQDLAKGQEPIVKTVIALAHGLKMDTIAEGVETSEQLDKLKLLGCEYAQGYYFARPLNSQKVEDLIC